jgi:hypothetical protein
MTTGPSNRVAKPAVVASIALLANSAYLYALPSPTLFYYTNVGLHLFIGLGFVIGGGMFALRAVRMGSSSSGFLLIGAAVVLAASVGFGGWIAFTGATRAHQAAVNAHVLSGVGGLLLLAAWSVSRSPRSTAAVALAVSVVGLILLAAAVRPAVERSRQARHRIQNPSVPPATMNAEGGGPQSPFFPSSAKTNVGGIIPANFFMTSASCGRCHKDIYDQWNSSAHHFSSFNNQWYRKSIEYMQDTVGTQPSKWCAGCHDHAVFFNGRFDRPIKEQIATPEAQAGLACTSCHSIVHVGSSMGQGDFTVEYPPLHDLAASDQPVLQKTHDALIYLAPGPHRDTFLKPFHREQTAEFCSSCHKVHLDTAVNSYRWFRGFNDYDNWQASGVSGQGARSFYYPAKPQKCADCHMPLVASNDPAAKGGKVRSHRFPGANTALPIVNHDPVQLKVVQDFLRDGQISVDVFGITRVVEAVDDKGRVLLHSGSVADGGKGPVEPGAHFYRSLQLDAHGNPINKRNAWSTRSVAYVRLVPPGAADTIHYRLDIPPDAGDKIVLRAKVNYRKFAWWNTQWAFAGVRPPSPSKPDVTPEYDDGEWRFDGDTSGVSGQIKAIPDIPTTVMAQSEASLAVIPRGALLPDVKPLFSQAVRERWNDYGIGLLLQGDLKAAEAAFMNVTEMDPGYADGPVNVARAQIQEGNVTAAEPMLQKALAIDPKLAKAHYFLGTVYKTIGRYDEALVELRAAAAQYPRDRVVLDQIGRVLFLQRKFADAVKAFEQVLSVDPEDLQAHYNLMVSYQGLGQPELAAREQALYERFKADESAQAITGPYRLKSPHDNNERQSIHEHRHQAVAPAAKAAAFAPSGLRRARALP